MTLTDEQLKEVRRARLKLSAQHRAEVAFEHALDRIDRRLNVLEPALKEIDARVAQGELPVEAS